MNDNDIRALLSRLDNLEGRVGRLKASNRLLSWALLGLLAVGAFLFILSAAAQPDVQDVVRARSFTVVGDDGKPRALFTALSNDSVGLSLHDASGQMRAALCTDPNGSVYLNLMDARGKIRESLQVDPEGAPALVLYDRDEKRRGIFKTLPNGEPGLVLIDAKDNPMAGLNVIGDHGTLGISDADGNTLFHAP